MLSTCHVVLSTLFSCLKCVMAYSEQNFGRNKENDIIHQFFFFFFLCMGINALFLPFHIHHLVKKTEKSLRNRSGVKNIVWFCSGSGFIFSALIWQLMTVRNSCFRGSDTSHRDTSGQNTNVCKTKIHIF